jgi:hypothetical protein
MDVQLGLDMLSLREWDIDILGRHGKETSPLQGMDLAMMELDTVGYFAIYPSQP